MTEPILVKPADGGCRVCQGQLGILDADDATMTVECQDCGETYLVEPDAFGDGGIVYYPAILAAPLERNPSPEENQAAE